MIRAVDEIASPELNYSSSGWLSFTPGGPHSSLPSRSQCPGPHGLEPQSQLWNSNAFISRSQSQCWVWLIVQASPFFSLGGLALEPLWNEGHGSVSISLTCMSSVAFSFSSYCHFPVGFDLWIRGRRKRKEETWKTDSLSLSGKRPTPSFFLSASSWALWSLLRGPSNLESLHMGGCCLIPVGPSQFFHQS